MDRLDMLDKLDRIDRLDITSPLPTGRQAQPLSQVRGEKIELLRFPGNKK